MLQQLSRHGIGASEIAAIAGLNPFASQWDIWCRKTGRLPDVDSAPMEWGIRLEPAIRQAYCDKTGLTVEVPRESLFQSVITWARATPDGIVYEGKSRDRLLQCKNVGEWPGKSWNGQPPYYVQLQEQWEMFVTNDTRADVAVLIGGNEFRIYTVHRDDKIITDLVDIASEFWRRVEHNVEPDLDDSEACQRHFESKFARADAIELVADSDVEELFGQWHELTRKQKRLTKDIDTIRNAVRKVMAEAKADRIASSIGTAKLLLKDASNSPEVDWEGIARLLGSTKVTPAEFAELISGATTIKLSPASQTLYAPRNWAKES